MTKAELVARIAKEAHISKRQADTAMNAFLSGVTASLKKGRKVSFVGFGTFSVAKRKARIGRASVGIPITVARRREAHLGSVLDAFGKDYLNGIIK